MEFTELKKIIAEQVSSLKAVPYQPTETIDYEYITIDGTEKDNARWREIMAEKLKTARSFEIHCWKDETEALCLALEYGQVKPFDWKHGTVVAGPVTPEFTAMLLNTPKPSDLEICNKMTPFFTIMLDNGFSSEHYGTELIHSKPGGSL